MSVLRRSLAATATLAASTAALSLPPARLTAQPPAGAQSADVRARYVKREVYIRMRDGVRLFTSIYEPRDTTQRWPIMLNRSPYSVAPYGDTAYRATLGPSAHFQRDGYIFVYQDVRGRYMSEGTYAYMTPHLARKRGAKDVDESSDTYDTIRWLLRNVRANNGRVGTWGISAPGFFVAAGMIDAHPALKAASPQAPLIDWFMGDDRHHNGALMLAQTFNFLSGFDRPRAGPTQRYEPRPNFGTPDGYEFFLAHSPVSRLDERWLKGTATFWNAIMEHDTYDAFWRKRSLQHHLKDIRPAVLHVGGWYDAEDPFGPLEAFRSMNQRSPRATHTLVMGPWDHGGWSRGTGTSFGPIRFGDSTSVFYRDSIEHPWFSCLLRDRCTAASTLPKAIVYETGTNAWRRYDAWPPREAVQRPMHLRAGGRLTWEAPTEAGSFTEWVSDPAKPVPYTTATSFGYWRTYPIEDQRFASRRPDVMVYRTEPLTQPLTLAGPIQVRLHASTSGTDADFIVKVIDVYPDNLADSLAAQPGTRLGGYEQLVRGDVMRAKFRRSFSQPVPMTPDAPDLVEFTIQDVFHTLKAGHRLMVQVQSTWFPLVDLNPGTFTQINRAKPEDFRATTQRVWHAPDRPSAVVLTVLGTP